MNRTITIRLILIVLAVALLAGLLLLADFRLAFNTTTHNSTASSARTAARLDPNQKLPLYLWIEEKDRLSTELRDALLDALRASGRFDPALLPTPKPAAKDFPILRVWIERPGYSWTPVYAQADMQVRWAFSSANTDVSFEGKPFNLNQAAGPAVMAGGTLTLRDRATGLVSLPGYWNHLSAQAAQALQAELVRQLDQ